MRCNFIIQKSAVYISGVKPKGQKVAAKDCENGLTIINSGVCACLCEYVCACVCVSGCVCVCVHACLCVLILFLKYIADPNSLLVLGLI